MGSRTLNWNEAELWAGAFSAVRYVQGGMERSMTACIVRANDKEESVRLAMQEALSVLPESEGWKGHQVATVNYTIEVSGPIPFIGTR